MPLMPLKGDLIFLGYLSVTLLTLIFLTVACRGGNDSLAFTGDWELLDETDPFTDEGYLGIWLDASEHDLGRNYEPSLVLQCRDGTSFSVYVVWQKPLDATSEEIPPYWASRNTPRNKLVEIDWRVDLSEPEKSDWVLSEDRRATFHPNSPNHYDTPIDDDLRRASKVSLRVYGHGDEVQGTAVFRPAGFSNAYRAIEEACSTTR